MIRKSDTRTIPSPRLAVKITQPLIPADNAIKQRKALARMTECELACGKTAEQLDAMHAEQRARVLARYRVAA